MEMKKAFAAIVAISSVFVEAFAATEAPPLFFFKDGRVGFNFLGFHGAAGLNALDNGGGLHAEVGTPFGQQAAAGFSGAMKSDGNLGGQLYAGATAGGNVKAAAGLGGTLTPGEEPRVVGSLYSAASAGVAKSGATLSGGVSDRGSFKLVEKVSGVEEPKKVDDVEATPPHDTENRIKKTYTVRGRPVKFDKFFSLQGVNNPTSGTEEKDDLNATPVESVAAATDDKVVAVPANGVSFLSQFFAAPTSMTTSNRSSFFDSIFQIPISTLSAVNQFLNTIPGTKTSVVVEKSSSIL